MIKLRVATFTGIRPAWQNTRAATVWVPQPSQPTPTDTVGVYPPIPAGLSRKKHVARLSLQSLIWVILGEESC